MSMEYNRYCSLLKLILSLSYVYHFSPLWDHLIITGSKSLGAHECSEASRRSVNLVIPPVVEWHLQKHSIYGLPSSYASSAK